MDVVNPLLTECVALAVQVGLSYVLYRTYKKSAECLKSLKEAECFELDNELLNSVEKSGGIVKYAIISGNVKALAAPLRSQYNPILQGVIQEKIPVRNTFKWRYLLTIWRYSAQGFKELQPSLHYIPFALCNKSHSLFEKQVRVEVVEPLVAQELVLHIASDESTLSFWDAVVDLFRWRRINFIQEFKICLRNYFQHISSLTCGGFANWERFLYENETLTCIGKLVLEDNMLKIKPPDDGLKYFLTPLSLESLINKISAKTSVFKVFTVIMGTCSLAFFVYVSRHAFSEIKKKIQDNQLKKRLEQQSRLRRMADRSQNDRDVNIQKCVVCQEYPVEVLILECGHVCLCYSCAEQNKTLCPICRNPIERFVSTFWP